MAHFDLTETYRDAATDPMELTPEEYLAALRLLLSKGKAYKKTAAQLAVILDPLMTTLEGESPTNAREPSHTWDNPVKMDCVVTMDPRSYPVKNMMLKGIGIEIFFDALKTLVLAYGRTELNKQALKGIKTLDITTFLGLYAPQPDVETRERRIKVGDEIVTIQEPVNSVWVPTEKSLLLEFNEAAEHLIGRKFRVHWGGVYNACEAGGALCIKEANIAELAEAVASIKDSNDRAEILEKLYRNDEKKGLVPKFKVYVFDGPEPGQETEIEANHAPSEFDPYTIGILNVFGNDMMPTPPSHRVTFHGCNR